MKKLKRSKGNKMISGVCGGIGEYFNIDPTIIRIIWIAAAFLSLGTLAVILYIILIFIIPPDDGIIDV
ncbi:MAG: PspC domain-containing protein [Clostridiales bacterium]|nr:PspC domain-containing protein [Clostridiales bacterium]MCD8215421.1 PspC domain-containing protein [Clostridiales bacterium]